MASKGPGKGDLKDTTIVRVSYKKNFLGLIKKVL